MGAVQESLLPFHLTVKPHGAVCNLDCSYCYYLEKEALYPGRSRRMAPAVLERFIEPYIAAHAGQRGAEVVFGWQGGEPTLMGLDFFRQVVALQATYRRPGMRIRNTLQTNGVLLDEAWASFLADHRFLVGISIDGPAHLHDVYRVDKVGQPTFKRVLKGLRWLQARGVTTNVLTAVHAANAPHPLSVYRFLRDEIGARHIQFIPIVEKSGEGSSLSASSVSGQAYGEFLVTIFDEWVRRDVGQVFVQIFDEALAAWAGQAPSLCIYRPTCGQALALEHTGDLYPCDHFVEPALCLGNIQQLSLGELARSPAQLAFGNAKLDLLPGYCRDCEMVFICHGGCPKDRFLSTPEGEPGLNALCAGYRMFFTHIDHAMRKMAAELQAGRPPANITTHMAALDTAWARSVAAAGRNDPCPCGSGRKFKRCHGQRALAGGAVPGRMTC
jgi:uncharacterized protein